jgi:hypothetical protein
VPQKLRQVTLPRSRKRDRAVEQGECHTDLFKNIGRMTALLLATEAFAQSLITEPLMLVCTARPEFRSHWPMRSHHTQITLNRLSGRDVREMVAQVAARNALNSQSIDAVIERTGGNPLFVEELTRAVLESGGISARTIPVTLHDSLMARLDRLGSAKAVLQLGSVMGATAAAASDFRDAITLAQKRREDVGAAGDHEPGAAAREAGAPR